MPDSSRSFATGMIPVNGSGNPIRVRIRNFQSVEDVELTVDGFTCIFGKTNIGKSAIMRAISSAILNDPVIGKVRKGSQFCTVELSCAGWGFKWEKGERGVNRYTIGDRVYDKVGQRQLDEIVQMGFGSVKVGDQEVQPWWSSQFMPLFLLDKSGPHVTDFISEVSRLTVLQDAVVLAARGKRQASDEAKSKSEEAAVLRDRLSKVSCLDLLSKLHEELEQQAQSIRSYESRLASGQAMAAKIEASAHKIRVLSGVSMATIPEDKVGPKVDVMSDMFSHWTALESCAKRVITLRDVSRASVPHEPAEQYTRWRAAATFAKVDGLRRSVVAMKSISGVTIPDLHETAEEAALVLTASRLRERLDGLRRAVEALSVAIPVPSDPAEISEAQKALCVMSMAASLRKEAAGLESRQKAADKELRSLEKEIRSIPSCPTCSRPIDQDHRHKAYE